MKKLIFLLYVTMVISGISAFAKPQVITTSRSNIRHYLKAGDDGKYSIKLDAGDYTLMLDPDELAQVRTSAVITFDNVQGLVVNDKPDNRTASITKSSNAVNITIPRGGATIRWTTIYNPVTGKR